MLDRINFFYRLCVQIKEHAVRTHCDLEQIVEKFEVKSVSSFDCTEVGFGHLIHLNVLQIVLLDHSNQAKSHRFVLFVKRVFIKVVVFKVPSWDVVLTVLFQFDNPHNFLLDVPVTEMISNDAELCILD